MPGYHKLFKLPFTKIKKAQQIYFSNLPYFFREYLVSKINHINNYLSILFFKDVPDIWLGSNCFSVKLLTTTTTTTTTTITITTTTTHDPKCGPRGVGKVPGFFSPFFANALKSIDLTSPSFHITSYSDITCS